MALKRSDAAPSSEVTGLTLFDLATLSGLEPSRAAVKALRLIPVEVMEEGQGKGAAAWRNGLWVTVGDGFSTTLRLQFRLKKMDSGIESSLKLLVGENIAKRLASIDFTIVAKRTAFFSASKTAVKATPILTLAAAFQLAGLAPDSNVTEHGDVTAYLSILDNGILFKLVRHTKAALWIRLFNTSLSLSAMLNKL